MFGKLKEKLKGWIKKSKKDIEEKAEKVEKPGEEKAEKVEKPKSREDTSKKPLGVLDKKQEIKKKKQIEKEIQEVEKQIEQAKTKETPKTVKQAITREDTSKPEKILKNFLGKPLGVLDIKKTQEAAQDIAEETETPPAQDIAEETKKEKGFFSKVKSKFSYKIDEKEFNSIFEDLEMLLLENNVALEVVEDIEKKLSEKLILPC